MRKRIKLQHTVKLIDDGTGEIKQEIKTYSSKVYSDDYFTIYANRFKEIVKLNLSAKELSFLFLLACKSQYNTGVVALDRIYKDECCELLNIKLATLHNLISLLMKKGLVRKNKDNYILDHKLIWKGAQDERKDKLIQDEVRGIIEEQKEKAREQEVNEFFDYRLAQEREFVEGFAFQVYENGAWIDKVWNAQCRVDYRGERLIHLLKDNLIRIKI